MYAVTSLLLIVRRRSPLGCLLAIVVVSVIGYAIVGSPEGLGVQLPTLVAAYTVGRHETWARSWWGLVLVTVLWAAWAALDPTEQPSGQSPFLTAIWLGPWVIAWLVGALVRSSAALTEQRRWPANSAHPARSPRSATASPASCTT